MRRKLGLQRSRRGHKAITLSVPCRYVHTVTEMVHADDVAGADGDEVDARSDQVAGILDQSVAGGIDLDYVQGAAFGYGKAHGAGIAGLTPPRRHAVERFRQDTAGAGFAGAARPAEKVSMAYTATLYGTAQRCGNVLLPYYFR